MIKMVTEQLEVESKFVNKATRPDGTPVEYYNIKVITYGNNQIIGVPKEVYDAVEVGDKIFLKGNFGGLKDKYWRCDALFDPEAKKPTK